MSSSFSHLTSQEKKEAEQVEMKADIAALKLKLQEYQQEETCQIDPESVAMQEFRKLEESIDAILNNFANDFKNNKEKITKEKIEMCGALLNLLDRYRNSKVQTEILKKSKFSTKAITH